TMQQCTRYLIFFQYIGTKYRYVALNFHIYQFILYLFDAVRKLRPLNPVSLSVSSRTDTGVHALSNSAHFDLQRKKDQPPFTEDILVKALNYHLGTEEIRVTHAHRVPDNFHARYCARSRTYVYRIAPGISHPTMLPLTEHNLCWGFCNTELDIGAMHEAAALLVGTHDFSTFRAVSSDLPFKNPVKTLEVADIRPGASFCLSHFHRTIPFWELTFRSKSFLYRQVRRMTGALVAVGQGRLSVSQLKDLLEAQDSNAYPQGLTAPPQGLFLTRVDYMDSGEEVTVSSGKCWIRKVTQRSLFTY
uniref:tRNA pseudouridine synthase n=1 Tax=Cynoglossus semilaevis TaxID=244447 RepID=A0A3P8V4G7_CYNSE